MASLSPEEYLFSEQEVDLLRHLTEQEGWRVYQQLLKVRSAVNLGLMAQEGDYDTWRRQQGAHFELIEIGADLEAILTDSEGDDTLIGDKDGYGETGI
tara:strand:+ start:124 stop:417 length:294 start_codon:yes stop_codon:yes gene_type:complete